MKQLFSFTGICALIVIIFFGALLYDAYALKGKRERKTTIIALCKAECTPAKVISIDFVKVQCECEEYYHD